MTRRLPNSDYRPPPQHVTEPLECPCDVGRADVRVFYRQNIYRGRVCEFSISVQVITPDGWVDIYRVDTTHGVLHDHIFGPDGSDRRTVAEVISGESPWDTITEAFETHLAAILDAWEHHYRRWSG